MSVLERTKGSIAFGGKVDDKNGFEPTVVQDVLGSDSLMEEYGLLLPIRSVTCQLNTHPFQGNIWPHPSDCPRG